MSSGWSPVETFETGIRKTVAWYLGRDRRGLGHRLDIGARHLLYAFT